MANNYWKPEHQKAIEDYYYCSTASTSAITRNYIYSTILYKPLTILIKTAIIKINSFLLNDSDDLFQDCHMNLIKQVLPSLKKEKIKAAFYLMYISTQNFIKSQILKDCVRKKLKIDSNYANYSFGDNDDVQEFNHYLIDDNADEIEDENKKLIRKQILDAIDNKIIVVNELRDKKNTSKPMLLFILTELKSFLIKNDFDERGFFDYIMLKTEMNSYKLSKYFARLNISIPVFRMPVVEEYDEKISKIKEYYRHYNANTLKSKRNYHYIRVDSTKKKQIKYDLITDEINKEIMEKKTIKTSRIAKNLHYSFCTVNNFLKENQEIVKKINDHNNKKIEK